MPWLTAAYKKQVMQGKWKVKYRYEEHEWEIKGDILTVNGKHSQKIDFSKGDISLPVPEDKSKKMTLDLLVGENSFVVGVIGPSGVYKGDTYVANIGGTLLVLKNGKCMAYEADFDGPSPELTYKPEAKQANCKLEKKDDTKFFVYKDVKEALGDTVSDELKAIGGLLLSDSLEENRAVRM